jgi:hypothetical protein
MHEEALRVNRMCPELRKKDMFQTVLKHYHERSLEMYEEIDEEDDFRVSCFTIRNILLYGSVPGTSRASPSSSLNQIPTLPVIPRLLQPPSHRPFPILGT